MAVNWVDTPTGQKPWYVTPNLETVLECPSLQSTSRPGLRRPLADAEELPIARSIIGPTDDHVASRRKTGRSSAVRLERTSAGRTLGEPVGVKLIATGAQILSYTVIENFYILCNLLYF